MSYARHCLVVETKIKLITKYKLKFAVSVMKEKNRMMKPGKETNIRKVLTIGPMSTSKTLFCLATFVMYVSLYVSPSLSLLSQTSLLPVLDREVRHHSFALYLIINLLPLLIGGHGISAFLS